jgi:CDP-2,3-bis-(O-geranylgeranyl)-sn-glycerol synthase
MAADSAVLLLYLKLLLLLGVANGAALFGHTLFRERLAFPVDGGLRFPDGRPLFGASKTVRGIVLALVCTPLAAWVLGLEPSTGLLIGAFAMLGDLTSSFVKRRLAFATSSQALGIDQVPESLFPLLAVRVRYGLSGLEITLMVVAFFFLELVLSRLLYRLRLRDQPY